ncbi:MAG: SMC family ATPase [Clostridia bacterium]|nr:SMC family ATPase [Clostridia bacterium]
MKPLRLEFQGINSFSEHTIIDFESLTKNGIFGIFGDTGSGKSTILDCINFALYGNVERSKEKTDIINFRSNRADVKFVFNILNGGKRKTYTVERTLKRDKSGTHKAFLYEDDKCIAEKTTEVEKKIVEILGVEDEDFRKCIALPQGEFSQFVKSTPSGRLALIERLFSLYKYGDRLKEKISSRQNAAEAEFQNVAGRLSGYEEVTAEALENKKKELSETAKRLEKLTAQAAEAAKRCEELKALHEKCAELNDTEEKLKKLEQASQSMKALKMDLKLLPVCNEAVKIYNDVLAKQREINSADGEITNILNKLSAQTAELAETEKELANGDFEGRIAERLKLEASYKTLEGKPEKLRGVKCELDKKRAAYRDKEQFLKLLYAKAEQAENEVKSAEASLKNSSAGDVEQLVSVQFKGAVLREEYAKSLNYFAELGSTVKIYKENSPLYKFISEEVAKKTEEYKERLLNVKDFKTDDVKKRLQEIQLADAEREKLQIGLSEKRLNLQKLIAEVQVAQKELETLQRDGAELRKRADELDGELKKIFGENCADFSGAAARNESELKRLEAQKKQILEKLEGQKRALNELNINIERQKALKAAAEKDCAALNAKLEKTVADGGFPSFEACKALAGKYCGYGDAEKTLEEYERQLSALTEKHNSLKEYANSGYSDEAYNACLKEREALETDVKALTGNKAVLAEGCKTLEKRLAEKAEILKEAERIEKERNLILALKEVTKGNKFMEFIANEYLCDISALASSTLLKLTDGRYFLSYKDNNFFVADNFDCGNLRGVNTLSGGETFLVSLSLALALSQTICAKSLKSIEFFFLDEGFGTLDSTLVDTVMSALEKLKSSSFTIGVISHVEELKHRIDSKITVKKATESHGSTVQLSC